MKKLPKEKKVRIINKNLIEMNFHILSNNKIQLNFLFLFFLLAGSLKKDKDYKSKLEHLTQIKDRLVSLEGSFRNFDKPKKIQLIKRINNELFCLVEWLPRSNGVTPFWSLINSKEFKKNEPVMLINFYEKKISWNQSEIGFQRTLDVNKLLERNNN